MRLLWGLSVLSTAAIIGAAVAADLLIHAPSSLILQAWRRRRDDRYDRYWGLGAYTEDAVSTALAAAGAEASAGCPCEGCGRIRATVAEAMFRATADDLAELNRIGIAWEAS